MKTAIPYLLTAILLLASCSKLEEDTSQITPYNELFASEERAALFTQQVYANFSPETVMNGGAMLSEIVSDEMARLNRLDIFGWSYFPELYRHFFQTLLWENTNLQVWSNLYRMIETSSQVIVLMENSPYQEVVQPYLAELKVFRAYFYLQLIDLYGNVPIVETSSPNPLPCTRSRQEVFDFIEKSILDNLAHLEKDNGEIRNDRINYYSAQAILAKLYLNAGVYTGVPTWDKAAAACDAIISSGQYALLDYYFDNFNSFQTGTRETIFAAICQYDQPCWLPYHFSSLAPVHLAMLKNIATIGFPDDLVVPPDFYDLFDVDDIRLKMFYQGPQLDAQGNPILDDQADDPDGPALNYTRDFDILNPLRQDGIRFAKFEITDCQTNDNFLTCYYSDLAFPIFRYSDILLMKAEALLRQNTDPGTALSLVNEVRERSGANPLGELTLDELLAERGRELFAEGWRRSDLIRFGKFNDARWQKEADADDHVNLFPIPQNNSYNSPCMVQNPGY